MSQGKAIQSTRRSLQQLVSCVSSCCVSRLSVATPSSTTRNPDGAQYRISSTDCALFHWSPPDGCGFASGPVVEADDFETCPILLGCKNDGPCKGPSFLHPSRMVQVSKSSA